MRKKNADAVVKFLIDLSNKDAIKGIEKLDEKSEALARKFNSAGKALTMGLTTPIVAFGAYAVKTSTDFEKASNSIQSSLGLTNQEAENYSNIMREIYNANYGASFEDVAQKIAYVKQVTGEIDPPKIKELTTNAIALEDTFGSDFNETIRGVNNLMTHFGISSEEAFDLFAKGSQLGLDYTSELGDNIAEYGGNFKQAGYSAKEYFQLLQNGTKNGAYNLDKVNDSINEVKNRLGDGSIKQNLSMFSKETRKAFSNWEKGNGTMKDIIDSIVSDITTCTNEQKKLTMAATAFGTMGEDANLKVVESLTSLGEEFNHVEGSMKNIKDVKYNDLGSMFEEIKRQVGDVALTLGNELMPHLISFTSKISSIIAKFKELSPETQALIFKIMGIAAAVGPLLIIMSKIGPLMSGITAVISFVASPIGLLVLAIGALVGVFVYLMATSEEFRQAMQVIFSFVWSYVQPIIQNIMNLFNGLVQIIKGCVMVIAGLLTGDFKMVAQGFSSIFRGIGNVIISVLNGAINNINRFVKLALAPINAVIAAVNKIPGVNLKKVRISIPNIPALKVGTNYVADDGLAYLHEGEAVVPKKYNPAVGGAYNGNAVNNITVIADMDVNKFGKAFVREVKTFSGGAKNSYNYGGSQ